MIAYYVHHHGSGHAHRAASISSKLRTPVVGLSSRPPPVGWDGPWLRLADDAGDVEPCGRDVTAHSTMHWVPLHHEGLRTRMAAISELLAEGRVELLVSDVSVEVAVLARLHGVPVVVMAQPGDRTDRAHRLAYDLADRLLAPWPSFPARSWPQAWLAKTAHLGAFSRYDDRSRPGRPHDQGRRVLVVWGTGGSAVTRQLVHAAALATPGWSWQLAGPTSSTATGATAADADVAPHGGTASHGGAASHVRAAGDLGAAPNVEELGWVEDLWPALCGADVVITHAGQNSIGEISAARRPAVVIPQERPFGEQHATADALEVSGISTIVREWPDPSAWSGILERTARRDGSEWSRWSPGDGARRAADEIERQLQRHRS